MVFFPRKLAGAGSPLSLCCFVSWNGEDLGTCLKAKCTCLIMELPQSWSSNWEVWICLGLLGAECLLEPDIPALLKIIKNKGDFNYFPISFPRLRAELLEY